MILPAFGPVYGVVRNILWMEATTAVAFVPVHRVFVLFLSA